MIRKQLMQTWMSNNEWVIFFLVPVILKVRSKSKAQREGTREGEKKKKNYGSERGDTDAKETILGCVQIKFSNSSLRKQIIFLGFHFQRFCGHQLQKGQVINMWMINVSLPWKSFLLARQKTLHIKEAHKQAAVAECDLIAPRLCEITRGNRSA